MKKITIVFLLLILVSCEDKLDQTESLGENTGIVGTWVERELNDDVSVLSREEALDSTRYGFRIMEDGSFVERANAGWCGTPPIFYTDYDGTWEALSDSLLEITVGYWGGVKTYQMRIVSVDADSLRIRYLWAENMTDAR